MLEEDEALLRRKAKECRNPNEKMRYFALHAISIGDTLSDTAKRFLVDRSTVYDWILEWKHEKRLADKPKEGRSLSFGRRKRRNSRSWLRKTTHRSTLQYYNVGYEGLTALP